jgi:hypothetical protein
MGIGSAQLSQLLSQAKPTLVNELFVWLSSAITGLA